MLQQLRFDEETLANTIYQLGEERFSRRIAKQLKALLPKTTFEAVEAIKRAVPRKAWGSIHVATRTFQALRIAVNHELDQLTAALAKLPTALNPGGIVSDSISVTNPAGYSRLISDSIELPITDSPPGSIH